ncbi:MAG: UDP-N-acetylmuramoyl-L-alanine--D-glutamate ligase, partial [Gammaproteobacteria bacterium]
MAAAADARQPAFESGTRVAVLGLGVSGEAAARLDVCDDAGPRAATDRLRALGIDAESGTHDMDRIAACDLVIVSPGIGPTSDVRRQVLAKGIRTIAEVELAWRDLEGGSIAITGTNGKTTTTGLVAHILTTDGTEAAAAGNIGRPLSDIVLGFPQPDWVAIELSSFQLADMETLSPDVGVLLNLSPDHLDRYEDVDSYYADKGCLFANATSSSAWVLNADDPATDRLAGEAAGRRCHFSVSSRPAEGAWLDPDGMLRCRLPERGEETWGAAGELRLLGPHNVANALAAALACALVGTPGEAIQEALASFEPLPHRLQPIGERDGVLWVNDSKATNVTATAVAVRS